MQDLQGSQREDGFLGQESWQCLGAFLRVVDLRLGSEEVGEHSFA